MRKNELLTPWQNCSGAKLVPSHERKLPYGGLGLPIREEIVARNGADIITRNGYGARCLNEPDVLFADIDMQRKCKAWISDYETRSMVYASCQWLGELGSGKVHDRCKQVQRIHDEMSQAHANLPIA
ncbi:MAG: hypothetical protein ACI8UD_002340 [Planctomycetota bacterium]|jgi:hypothetical protein